MYMSYLPVITIGAINPQGGALIAVMVEHETSNVWVAGSSPTLGTGRQGMKMCMWHMDWQEGV